MFSSWFFEYIFVVLKGQFLKCQVFFKKMFSSIFLTLKICCWNLTVSSFLHEIHIFFLTCLYYNQGSWWQTTETPDNFGSKGIYRKAIGYLTELMENAREWGLGNGQEWKGAGMEDSPEVTPLEYGRWATASAQESPSPGVLLPHDTNSPQNLNSTTATTKPWLLWSLLSWHHLLHIQHFRQGFLN